jgi:hypothetical protein
VDVEWKNTVLYEEALSLVQKKALNFIHFGAYSRGEGL